MTELARAVPEARSTTAFSSLDSPRSLDVCLRLFPVLPDLEYLGSLQTCYQQGMSGDHLVNAWIQDQWARRRRRSGCSSMNSSTAVRNADDCDDGAFRFKNSTNCLTTSCCPGVSEIMRSARFSAAILPSTHSVPWRHRRNVA